MNKILNLFTKNSLLILVGLFFVSSFTLDPFFHEALEEDHSNLECHFCLNEISDETLLDLETNISFLSNLKTFLQGLLLKFKIIFLNFIFGG